MKGARYFIAILAIALMLPTTARADEDETGLNPALAALIEGFSFQAEKTLKSQLAAQGLMTEGEIFIGREVRATSDFQREFNKYLDRFHDVIWTAAELYGTYTEIRKTVKHISNISNILSHQPENSLALLLTPNNTAYTDLYKSALAVGQEIYSACLTKDKRTEGDRSEVLDRVRKRIKDVNKKLLNLEMLLQYTTLEVAWYSLLGKIYLPSHSRDAIIDRCFNNWRLNVQSSL